MSKRPCLPLDPAKLIAHMKIRGLKEATVTKQLGYGQTYLSNCIMRRRIGKDFAMLLEQKYGITPEMYHPDTPFSLIDTPDAPIIDTRRLAETIVDEVFRRLEETHLISSFHKS